MDIAGRVQLESTHEAVLLGQEILLDLYVLIVPPALNRFEVLLRDLFVHLFGELKLRILLRIGVQFYSVDGGF